MSGYSKELASDYVSKRELYTEGDEEMFKILDTVGVKNKTILDFGCGDGRYSVVLKDMGAKEVFGIDVGEQMIKFANSKIKDKDGINFLVADGRDLPFENGRFDLVFSNFVLIAFNELLEPLKEISRTLKSGGHLIAVTNSAVKNKELHSKAIPILLGGKDGTLVNDFLESEEEIKSKIIESGLEIELFKELVAPYAQVDPDYIDKDKVKNFHAVLFLAKKP